MKTPRLAPASRNAQATCVKTLLASLDEPVRERADPECDEPGPEHVELRAWCLGAGSPSVRDPGEGDRDDRQRDVQEEDPPPRRPLDERTSERGAAEGHRSCPGRPDSDRPAALVAERRAEEREAPGRQKSTCRTLKDSGEDENGRARRDPAEGRGKGKTGAPDDEHSPPPQPIVEGSGDEIQGGERERVGKHDPLLRAEADPEVTPDLGEGNVDRRHRGHRGAKDRGDECQTAAGRFRQRGAAAEESPNSLRSAGPAALEKFDLTSARTSRQTST